MTDANVPDPQAQVQQSAPQEAPRRRRAPTDAEVLAGTGYEGLPECFALQQDDRSYIQEREPCYHIREDCFLGEGRYATLYEQDAIVVHLGPPNQCMEPLNRAAAVRYVKWASGLPDQQAPIDIGDLAQAAQTLGKDPEFLKLNKREWEAAVVKYASELKYARSGPRERYEILPASPHNFTRGVRGVAPPILGGRISELGERLPGPTRMAEAVPQWGPGAVSRPVRPAAMGHPGGR